MSTVDFKAKMDPLAWVLRRLHATEKIIKLKTLVETVPSVTDGIAVPITLEM